MSPTPRPTRPASDESVIGSTFYLMSLVDGWSPMNTDGWPAPFDTDLEARYGLGIQLVDGHRPAWPGSTGRHGVSRASASPRGSTTVRSTAGWPTSTPSKFRELPGLDVAADWLRRHKPSHWEPGIIHGDYQFANVMFAHGAPAQLAAMVDWEMSTVGDPLLDLGWVMNGWSDPGEDRT